MLGGVAVVTGSIITPGVVRQSGQHHRIVFGELDGRITPRCETIRDASEAAGINTELSGDIQRACGRNSSSLSRQVVSAPSAGYRSARCAMIRISRPC